MSVSGVSWHAAVRGVEDVFLARKAGDRVPVEVVGLRFVQG